MRRPSVPAFLCSLLLLAFPPVAPAAKPAPAPGKTGPVITGVTTQGETLSASTGAWRPRPDAYAYQWQRCDATGAGCADIAGATDADHLLALEDAGNTVRVVVTATGTGGSGTATSAPTGRIAGLPPSSTADPLLTGSPREGWRLSVSTGEWANAPTSFAYEWERCDATGTCAAIPGAVAAGYTPGAADVGSRLRARVTATSEWGSGQVVSGMSAPVAAAPPTGTGEIVYAAGHRMFRVDPTSGATTEVPVTAPPGYTDLKAYEPSLSPDGQEILFVYHALSGCCDPNGVAKVGAGGGEAVVHQRIYGGQVPWLMPRFSPDGAHYLWRAPDRRIKEAIVATGEVVAERGISEGSQITWSPDGQHVAHDRYSDFHWSSWIFFDGEEVVPNSSGIARFGMTGLDWGPDRFAFSRGGTIFLLPDDGSTAPVSTGLTGEWPTFSPDGTRFAYVADGDLYVAPVDGSTAPVRLTHTGAVIGPLDWGGGGVQPPAWVAPLVLLHGFTQTGAAWDGVRRGLAGAVVAPDLRGHGAAAAERPVDLPSVLGDLDEVIADGATLVGYSMGGRVALHWAVSRPGRLARLVLIGASPGLPSAEERAERRGADEALARRVEAIGLEAFAEEWASLPLFAGQPPEVRAAARADRLRQTPAGLAAALRGLGTGALPSLWDRLGEVEVPVDLVVGERDAKFVDLARRMAEALPRARVSVVPGVGHAVHLEDPSAVARILADDHPGS